MFAILFASAIAGSLLVFSDSVQGDSSHSAINTQINGSAMRLANAINELSALDTSYYDTVKFTYKTEEIYPKGESCTISISGNLLTINQDGNIATRAISSPFTGQWKCGDVINETLQ
jgi:hypothetical protein